jgi:acyl-coenzyme A synthetase/AMP-(fatty) acid ligase
MGRQRAEEPNDELIYFIVTELDDEQINRFCKENLLFAWRPDRIIHLEELPRTRSGKTRIGELKLMLKGAA